MNLTAPRIDACGRAVGRACTRSGHGLVGRICNRKPTVQVEAIAAPEKSVTEYQRPDSTGRYGKFGGKYVPETLIPALAQLEIDYKEAAADPAFRASTVAECCARHRTFVRHS